MTPTSATDDRNSGHLQALENLRQAARTSPILQQWVDEVAAALSVATSRAEQADEVAKVVERFLNEDEAPGDVPLHKLAVMMDGKWAEVAFWLGAFLVLCALAYVWEHAGW